MNLKKQLKQPITWVAFGLLFLVWKDIGSKGWFARGLVQNQVADLRRYQPNAMWTVNLKTGNQVTMNTEQLASALLQSKVSTFDEIKSK